MIVIKDLFFFPPHLTKRTNNPTKTQVIDFGCGEGALVSFLIWETQGDYPIKRLVGVDVDPGSLAQANEECQPQEFELGDNLRVNNLQIEFFQGSVSKADKRFLGFDALACMEV